jgi:hypothetical protein
VNQYTKLDYISDFLAGRDRSVLVRSFGNGTDLCPYKSVGDQLLDWAYLILNTVPRLILDAKDAIY